MSETRRRDARAVDALRRRAWRSNNVNFSLHERELRCLIGPNGAGKSTFFKCLTGQIRGRTSGRVFIRGQRRDRLGDPRDRPPGHRHQDAGALGDERPDRARRTCGCRRAASPGARRRRPRWTRSIAELSLDRHRAPAWSASWRTASASWSRSAWCSRSGPGWCCSTSRRPASPAPRPSGWSPSSGEINQHGDAHRGRSRHAVRAHARHAASRCSTRARSCVEGRVDKVLADAERARGLLGKPGAMTHDRHGHRSRPATRRRPARATSCSTSPTCAPATATCRCCTASRCSCTRARRSASSATTAWARPRCSRR